MRYSNERNRNPRLPWESTKTLLFGYLNWFEWLSNMLELNGDAYIYLRTSPEKSYERIKKRDREEETDISFEYIKEIHLKHEQWLNKQQRNILILDGDIENSQERLENFAEKILNFILNLNKTK